MAFDGIITRNVINELNTKLINARVEKIFVPTKNDIYLYFHTQNRENLKLLISIDATNARVHFTSNIKENPIKAAQICMVLRKHLQGSKLISITQVGLDRIIIFNFQTQNELGDLVNKKLIIELMGKYSNAILVNDTNKIIDSMRHVDFTMSSVREVLPNKEYTLPTSLGKHEFFETSFEQFKSIITQDNSQNILNAICNNFVGLSKSFVEKVLNNYNLESNIDIENSINYLEKIYDSISKTLNKLNKNVLILAGTNNSKDYTITDEIVTDNILISNFLDEFYYKKEIASLLKISKLNLEHDIRANLSKLSKKLELVCKTIYDNKDYEKYREFGELLTCNIHLVENGVDKINVFNYYKNENIDIPLKPDISASRNAQNYFKKYNKSKNAIFHANEYKNEYEKEVNYLESVLYEIDDALNFDDIEAIKEELCETGYIKKTKKNLKSKNEDCSRPLSYKIDGIEILVGKNNIQNDKLTLKTAKKDYMWLHTKDFHGSHVIIKSENVTDKVLFEAAKLAVEHSKAKNSSKVEVIYTLVKNVHKETGSKPGMVTYTDYHTIVI